MVRDFQHRLLWYGMASIGIMPAMAQTSIAYELEDSYSLSSSMSTTVPSSTSTGPVTHTVNVGKGGFTYSPDSITANAGDTVEFAFFPTNHSVVRAEYLYPCIPYEDTGSNKVGFFSGMILTDEISDDPPTFSVLINDTNPIFYYCSAPDSCIEEQMVGVINPNSSETLAIQKEFAANSSYMLQPGEAFPSEGDATSSSSSSSASATSSSSTGSSSTSKSSSGLSTGAIAGIVVGAVAVTALGALVFFFWGRNHELSRLIHRGQKQHPGGNDDYNNSTQAHAPTPTQPNDPLQYQPAAAAAAAYSPEKQNQGPVSPSYMYPSSELPGYSLHQSYHPPIYGGATSPPPPPPQASTSPGISDEAASVYGYARISSPRSPRGEHELFAQEPSHGPLLLHELPGDESNKV